MLDEDYNVSKAQKQETTEYACGMMRFGPIIVPYHLHVDM